MIASGGPFRPTPQQRARWLYTAAAMLVLFAITVAVYWRLVLTDQYTWMESPDLAYQVLPWFQFQAQQWHLGRFPLWEPASWGGQSLFGQGQPGAAYPPNWLLFNLPLEGGSISAAYLNWYFVLIHLGAAVTAYFLCRELGRSRIASLMGACVYAFGGYVADTKWPQMINGAVWTPLVFLFLFRAVRTGRLWSNALLSGCCLGAGWLAGHHQMNLLVSIAAAAMWIWLSFFGHARGAGRRPAASAGWRFALAGAASLAIAALASGFQTLPMAEYGPRALRWAGTAADPIPFDRTVPYSIHEQYALSPTSLLGAFLPGIQTQSRLFIGIGALALVVAGLVVYWRRRPARWLTAIAIGGLLFSLGPWSLLHGVLYSLLPLVEKARVPGAATLLFALGAAPLAAFGLDAVRGARSAAVIRMIEKCLLALGVALGVFAFLAFALGWETQTGDGAAMSAAASLVTAALLTAWRRRAMSRGVVSVALLVLVLFELSSLANYEFPNRADAERNPFLHHLREHDDIAAFLASKRGARIEYNDTQVPYNFGDWHSLETFNVLSASVAANIWGMEIFSERGKDLFGIRYYVGSSPNRDGMRLVFEGAGGINVYENPGAYPRAWVVHEVAAEPEGSDVAALLRREEFNARESAFVVGASVPALEQCPTEGEQTSVAMLEPNYVQIRATLACRGLVILSDPWFPGWGAAVDGEPAGILEADGGIRGVVVEAGTHTVEMKYRPMSVLLGGLMTLSAALITAVVWWFERRRTIAPALL